LPIVQLDRNKPSRARPVLLALSWHSLSKAPSGLLGAFRMVSGI
jgi:hypothetical protein